MGFPIVTGGAQSSTSLPLPTPDEVIRNVVASEERYEETHHHAKGGGSGSSNDGGGIRRRMIGTPLVTAGTDASSKLCATMIISYVEATACVPPGDGDIDSTDGSNAATGKHRRHHHHQQQQHVGLTAEVRVSISPTAASLSKHTRETTCRVRLPSGKRRGKGTAAAAAPTTPEEEDVRYGLTDVSPSVVFSSDGRYLACLMPCPVPLTLSTEEQILDSATLTTDDSISNYSGDSSTSGSPSGGIHRLPKNMVSEDSSPPLSTLVIFTLKRPLKKPGSDGSEAALPPIPGLYDGEQEQPRQSQQEESGIIPVATSPRSLTPSSMGKSGRGASPRIDRITSICPATNDARQQTSPNGHTPTSVLVAGTADGSILAVGYRRAKVAGVLYRPGRKRVNPVSSNSEGSPETRHSDAHSSRILIGPRALISMDYIAPSCSTGTGGGELSSSSGAGRLAVVRADGTVAIFRTLFVQPGSRSIDDRNTKSFFSDGIPPPIERNNSDTSVRESADIGDAGSIDGSISVRSASTPVRKDSDGSLESIRRSIRFTPPALSGAPGSVKQAKGGSSGPIAMETSVSEPLPRPSRTFSAGSASSVTGGLGLMMKIERLSAIRPSDEIPPCAKANWFNTSTIVLIARPYQPDLHEGTPRRPTRTPGGSSGCGRRIVAQIWSICNESGPESMATLRLGKDELVEASHGVFQLHHAPQNFAFQGANGPSRRASADVERTPWDERSQLVPLAYISSSMGMSRLVQGSDCVALSYPLLVESKSLGVSPSHVASRFAKGNGEADFAGTSTPSDNLGRKQKQLQIRPFVCIWDWRNSVLGFTLRVSIDQIVPQQLVPHDLISSPASTSLLSRLIFGCEPKAQISFLRAGSGQIQKEVYDVGLLSPPSSKKREDMFVEEASPLMITSDSVAFPLIEKSSASIDSNVFWRQAQIPHSYTSTHGPVRLATIGRRIGRSIAVASSRGLCVLDLSLVVAHNGSNERDIGNDRAHCVVGRACSNSPDAIPIGMKNGNAKWRLFRNEKEEQSFRVVAMSWWERNTEKNRTSEDLLVAAIEYMSPDKAPNQMQESQYFLVCWSRRRLGMGPYQLLGEADASLDSDRKVGIALPKGLKPNAISILAEPTGNRKDGRRGCPISSRAVLLVSSARSDAPVTYMAYQLQALESTPVSVIDALDNQNTSQVLSRLCSTGRIPSMGISSSQGHISSAFLAGASFQFDLTQNAALIGFDSHAHVATIGIIHADGSLSTVCVTPFGPSFGGFVVSKSYQKDGSKSQITNFWLSDVIEGGQLQSKYKDEEDLTSKATRENSFIWTLARNDGKVFSWRVPFFLNNQKLARANTEVTLRRTGTLDPNASTSMSTGSDSSLGTPTVVEASILFLHKDTGFLSDGTSEEDSTNTFLGNACYVGDSSCVTGNATNDNEIAIGPFPPASKGCVLYVGQNSRNLQPRLPNSQGMISPGPSPGARNILQFTIFGTGECILGPSTIISSLYLSYADVVSGQPALASNPISPNVLPSRNYINYLLRNRKNEDVVFSALRIIVLQTVDALASMRKRPNRNEKQAAVFARALLREVVSTTRSTLPPLVFCRFFLGLGRQLEPHDFTELFPLPYHDYELKRESPLSFESLFEESLRCGSIAIPSAALPLFSSRMKSLTWCKHLLWQCLYVIRKVIKENSSSELDESLEEREFILQLYKFGVKLEDVNNAESTSDYSNDETENEAMTSLDANSSLYDSYEYSDDDEVSSPNREHGEIQQPRSRMSRLVSLITPMIWDTTPAKSSKDEMEEKAIADAASTFIFSVFDEDKSTSENGEIFNQKDDISTNIDESIRTVVEEEMEEKSEEGEQSNFVERDTSCGTSVSRKLSIQVPLLVHRSIAGIVCEHLVDEFHEVWRFHPDHSSSTPSWMAIACIASLAGEGRGSLPLQTVADFRRVLQCVPEEDLTQYAKPGSNVLVDQIAEISQHLSGREAGSVFDLILVLLQRHEIHQDVQEYSVPLIIMAIIMGNISGRLDDVMVKGSTVDRWYSAVSFGGKRCEV